jgi:hypothetical protein
MSLRSPKRIQYRYYSHAHNTCLVAGPVRKTHVESSRDMESRNSSNQTGGSFSSRYHVWRGVPEASTCALAGKRRLYGNVMVVVEEYGADVALKRHGQNFGSRPVETPRPSRLLSALLVLSSLVLSPHGRFRLALVRHAEENKVTAKLDSEELGCHCKLSSATSDQI